MNKNKMIYQFPSNFTIRILFSSVLHYYMMMMRSFQRQWKGRGFFLSILDWGLIFSSHFLFRAIDRLTSRESRHWCNVLVTSSLFLWLSLSFWDRRQSYFLSFFLSFPSSSIARAFVSKRYQATSIIIFQLFADGVRAAWPNILWLYSRRIRHFYEAHKRQSADFEPIIVSNVRPGGEWVACWSRKRLRFYRQILYYS